MLLNLQSSINIEDGVGEAIVLLIGLFTSSTAHCSLRGVKH